MNTLFRIYMDFLGNTIGTLLLFRFMNNTLPTPPSRTSKICLLIFYFFYAIPNSHFPFSAEIFDFIYIILNSRSCIKKGILTFIKYNLYAYSSVIILIFLHAILLQDFVIFTSSIIYVHYKNIIVLFLSYVIYILYTNYKKYYKFRTRYHIYFNVVILAVCFVLSYSTLYICKIMPDSHILTLLFSTIIILILVCISLYDHFIILTEENANYRIRSEINHMQKNYALRAEETLKDLRSIRHDIKNHLIIIDGYASQKNCIKIHEYIEKIRAHFSGTELIQSPSIVVSAILNEKATLARQKGITCEVTCEFPYLKIDDFALTTILGNLFDNAITAAAKCSDGQIKVLLKQTDSLLAVTFKNNHMEVLTETEDSFVTTKKENPQLHGIGLKNVRAAVKELNGDIKITHTENDFYVRILIPNYN